MTGLDDAQIDNIMRKYPEYLGCIASDEIDLLDPTPRAINCFVINTDPHNKGGEHWQAVFCNARPHGSMSLEFYDSFGRKPSMELMKQLKDFANKLDAKTYLKFKENRVCVQSDATMNCGFFAVKFLIDRLRGKSFAEATGYDDHIVKNVKDGEHGIEEFKHQVGFGYIPSWSAVNRILPVPPQLSRQMAYSI